MVHVDFLCGRALLVFRSISSYCPLTFALALRMALSVMCMVRFFPLCFELKYHAHDGCQGYVQCDLSYIPNGRYSITWVYRHSLGAMKCGENERSIQHSIQYTLCVLCMNASRDTET